MHDEDFFCGEMFVHKRMIYDMPLFKGIEMTSYKEALTKKGPGIRNLFSVENTGFEPVTSCLPGKRSSQMS
jgi:hypothetical protein